MRYITKDHIKILERRLKFLEERLASRGHYSGDNYDKNEAEAIKTAVWYLRFLRMHKSVQSLIETEAECEAIIELEKELENE